MERFGDRVYTLTNQAYPFLVNDPTLHQSLAVPAFLKGLRDSNAAQEAMKFRDPNSIQEAVVTITHTQGASRIIGNRRVPTARQVSFDDRPITGAAPSTDMDLLQEVDSHLQQYAVTRKITPTSDACYTRGSSGHRSRECATRNRATATCYSCGGIGHYLFECSNRLRCTSSRKRTRSKRSAFRSLQRVRRHSPPRSVRSDPRSDQRTQIGSDVATVGVRGDRGYSVQLPFEGRAPMATSSDSRDSDCDRTKVESSSGCRVSVSMYDTNSHRETPASWLPSTLSSRLPSTLPSWLPPSPLSREPSSPLSRETSFPLSREPSLRERPTPSSRKRKRGYSGKSRQRRGPATSPAASVSDPDLDIVNAVSSNRCRVCVYGFTTERKTTASSRAFSLATANNGECIVRRKLSAGHDSNAVVSRCL